jgi:molybdopterin synthase catalytic subunit
MGETGRKTEIEVAVTTAPFAVNELYDDFVSREEPVTGTIVMHHGRVKVPGKVVVDFSRVTLDALVDDVVTALHQVAREATWKFHLHQIFIQHRLGEVGSGDDVLLVICSSATRREAFAACAWLVDEIKQEKIIALREWP